MALNRLGEKSIRIQNVFRILRKKTKKFSPPAINQIISQFGRNPFLILISCLLSLRAKDTISVVVSRNLFLYAQTPESIVSIPVGELEKMLYSVGFYRAKARIIQSVSRELIERFDAQVPSSESELMSIKGIGQKTAHAVLSYAYHIPALCVDTHVHQIANRLGWVATKTAEQTERELKKIIPKQYWIELNYLFVMWGQNVCTPVSPFCSSCDIAYECRKVGVKKHR
jgi:endonuclease III